MTMRIAKLTEDQLIKCIANSVWGSSMPFNTWQEGDLLAIHVENEIATVGIVCGSPYTSNTIIWDNGLFKNRIPMDYSIILSRGKRIPLKGKIRDAFYNTYGPQYGVIILNKYPIANSIEKLILNEIETHIKF